MEQESLLQIKKTPKKFIFARVFLEGFIAL